MVFGNLPSEYNKVSFPEETFSCDFVVQAVHGPYDPAVFYGKKDLPLREVHSSSSLTKCPGKILTRFPGEGLPAASLAAPPPVLQPNCIRARSLKVLHEKKAI